MYKGVFSDFEVVKQYMKIGSTTIEMGEGAEEYTEASCIGKSEEELEARVITKKCRGAVQREKVKGTGNGTLTESLHVPRDIYNKVYNMSRETLKTGVYAYGQNSSHPEISITQLVLDEDGEEKLKAYPRAVLEEGPKRAIENGQEEVPELELVFKLLPDDSGDCMYEALVKEIADESLKSSWLQNFTPDLVRNTTTSETTETTENTAPTA